MTMTLSNLSIASTLRITQPATSDKDQVLDIQFDLTKNATISNDFLALAFYELMNGYVTGATSGAATPGLKFTAYDRTDAVIMQTSPVSIDKIIDEVNTNLVVSADTTIASSGSDVYITKVTASFVSNNSGANEEFLVFTSLAPANTTFAEAIPAVTPAKRGILLSSGSSTKFMAEFTLYWKN